MSASPADPPPEEGRYYDGSTAAAHGAVATLRGGLLCIRAADGGVLAEWPLAEVAATGPLAPDGTGSFARAGSPARLVLPGSKLARALAQARRASPLPWVAATLAAALCVAALLGPFPTFLVPAPVEDALGRLAAESLIAGRQLCEGAAGQAALDALTRRLARAAGIDGPVSVQVLNTGESNAFALPGRRMVLLAGLLHDAEDSAELAGVMAHEMGHLMVRDPLRKFGRSIVLVGIGQLLGLGAAEQGGGLLLLTYDRAAEARADANAIAMLRRADLRADGLSRYLAAYDATAHSADLPSWLSTHPPTADRRAATATGAAGAEPLTADEFRAVRAICTE